MLRIKVLSGTAVKCLSHRRALLFAGPLGCRPGNIHGMDTLRLVSPNLPASSHGHNMVKLLTFAENYFYLQCVNSNIKSSSRGT